MTRRAFNRSLVATAGAFMAAGADAAAGDEPAKPTETPDPQAERLTAEIAAQVKDGLTAAERKRVREQVRGMADSLRPLRESALADGSEPSLAWAPVLPKAEGKEG